MGNKPVKYDGTTIIVEATDPLDESPRNVNSLPERLGTIDSNAPKVRMCVTALPAALVGVDCTVVLSNDITVKLQTRLNTHFSAPDMLFLDTALQPSPGKTERDNWVSKDYLQQIVSALNDQLVLNDERTGFHFGDSTEFRVKPRAEANDKISILNDGAGHLFTGGLPAPLMDLDLSIKTDGYKMKFASIVKSHASSPTEGVICTDATVVQTEGASDEWERDGYAYARAVRRLNDALEFSEDRKHVRFVGLSDWIPPLSNEPVTTSHIE